MKQYFNKAVEVAGNVLGHPATQGIVIGLGFVLLMFVLAISVAISNKSKDCDDKGDWLGYASQYVKNEGCQFKINGEWKNVSDMTFVLKEVK
jgi:p-aminobenzoyl-glutamate transporter AbgT